MGNSFVLLDTSSAVETEFGRGYRGRMPRRPRGENGDDVKKRMDRWKERVETVQRITKSGIQFRQLCSVGGCPGGGIVGAKTYGRTCTGTQ